MTTDARIQPGPHPWFRAIALDYDGTITLGGRPSECVLGALREVRQAGFRLVLATGRILDELRPEFPDVEVFFDAIVGENGGVLKLPRARERWLSRRIDDRLLRALEQLGAPVRVGKTILATQATEGEVLTGLIRQLGLDSQLHYNRGELMVLPPSVSKGTGVAEALRMLGLSAHECIGVGDAENDHSLLETCEVGVAVANAIPALKARADVVLEIPNGEGVVEFLNELRCPAAPRLLPMHRFLYLGIDEHGNAVRLPASHVNVLVQGDSGSGKSFLAGLIAERILRLGYTLCLVDPEGDHTNLARQPGVLLVGGGTPLLPVPHVRDLLQHRISSVVVDLCRVSEEERLSYLHELLDELLEQRRRTGLPHWLIVDEAHLPFSAGERWWTLDAERPTGLCIVTFRPEWLREGMVGPNDYVIDAIRPDEARIRRGQQPSVAFRPGLRDVYHHRHLGKYLHGTCPRSLAFRFRTRSGETGSLARNLRDFGTEVRLAPEASIRHHLANRDFSKWVRDVFRDEELAEDLAKIERTAATTDEARAAVGRVLEAHYPST